MRPQADMMGGISGLPVAENAVVILSHRAAVSAAIASKTIPSLVVAFATARFVAIAIVEVPIAGRARWFVSQS
jgi:hypothetical protein